MNTKTRWIWGGLWTANLLAWGLFALSQPTASAQQGSTEPFANSIEQRQQVVAELKELNAQLREQNALLKSGKLKVIVGRVEN